MSGTDSFYIPGGRSRKFPPSLRRGGNTSSVKIEKAAASCLAEAGALVAASWASSWDRDILRSALSSTPPSSFGLASSAVAVTVRQSSKSLPRVHSDKNHQVLSVAASAEQVNNVGGASAEFECLKASATIEDFRETSAFAEYPFLRHQKHEQQQWPLHENQAKLCQTRRR